MRQNLTGRNEVRYNSQTDAKPPAGFEDVAKSVGVPLSMVTMDAKGKVLHRQDTQAAAGGAPRTSRSQDDGWMTIPLPDEAVPVGHTWSLPQDIDIPAGRRRRQEDQGHAAVHPGGGQDRRGDDPGVHRHPHAGHRSGDRSRNWCSARPPAGCGSTSTPAAIIGQQMDIDKHVVGFRGEASSIHYLNRFSERLLADEVKTAEKTGGQAVEK